eukprot:gene1358-793_t
MRDINKEAMTTCWRIERKEASFPPSPLSPHKAQRKRQDFIYNIVELSSARRELLTAMWVKVFVSLYSMTTAPGTHLDLSGAAVDGHLFDALIISISSSSSSSLLLSGAHTNKQDTDTHRLFLSLTSAYILYERALHRTEKKKNNKQ